MTHLDLFSGIGGFALAARWAGFETVAFVEIDSFCQKVLAKNFPGVPIYGDIKKIQWVVTDTECNGWREYQGISSEISTDMEQHIKSSPKNSNHIRIPSIDLLTGGFPCQPFSCAGKRAGTEDDRFIWPEMLRAIHEVKPRWVLAENVPGLITLQDGLVFEGMCLDLENEGYEVLPLVIPACAQGAPHRRDRIWIVAKSTSGGCRSWGTKCEGQFGASTPNQSDCHAPDTDRFNGNNAGYGSGEISQFQEAEVSGCDSSDSDEFRQRTRTSRNVDDNPNKPSQCHRGEGKATRWDNHSGPWSEHWYEVATRLCTLDVRLSNGLVGPKGWRVNALKAVGNCVVPQIPYQIMLAIKEGIDAKQRFR